VKDDLTPILRDIESVDAIILGSPIYLGSISGEMKSFFERLVFPFFPYRKENDPDRTRFPKIISTGFIYTMNVPEERIKELGYDRHIALNEGFLRTIFGRSESLVCCDTYQFDDYSKIDQTRFDPEQKAARRKEQFPKDCQKAFEMGVRFGTPA
jgi:multimeric flavodoxin WrbA